MEEPFIVGLGTQVTLKLDFGDEVETLNVALVPDALADMYSGFLGEGTPLARAILGQAVGAVLPYQHGQVTIHAACVDERIMEKAKGCELAFAGNDMECRGMFQGFCGVASGLVD